VSSEGANETIEAWLLRLRGGQCPRLLKANCDELREAGFAEVFLSGRDLRCAPLSLDS